jgi:nucleoside-diphosphate-sugar epimerase
VHGTLVLLEAVVAQHPSLRFVFSSSSSVYGNGQRLPLRESDLAEAPSSPYADRSILGFEPRTSFSHGLSQFVSWFRAQ